MELIAGILKSKTMWFNGLLLLAGLTDWIAQATPLISSTFPGSGPLLAIVATVGVVLRFVTNTPLAEK